MPTTESWIRTTVLALSFFSSVLCTVMACPDKKSSVRFSDDSIRDESNRAKAKRTTFEACFSLRSLDRLPTNLGASFPVLRHLSCESLFPNPTKPPTDEQRQGAAACEEVRYLDIGFYPGSPSIIEWTKLLFPNVTELHLNIEKLPIRSSDATDHGRLEALKLAGVEKLVLGFYKDYDKFLYTAFLGPSAVSAEEPFLLSDNLGLFPNIKVLEFRAEGADTLLGPMIKNGSVVDSIESLHISELSADLEFLTGITRIFPLLRKLFISRDSFCKLMENFSRNASSSSPFESLTTLGIDCRHEEVKLTIEMANVFPSVVELVLQNLSVHTFPSTLSLKKEELHGGIKKLTVSGGVVGRDETNGCPPPAFFGSFFPGLESLAMADCGLNTIFSNNMACDREFFSRLKHLNIAGNKGFLDRLDYRMIPFYALSYQKEENSPCKKPKLAHGEPQGSALALAPDLEVLDMSGSDFFISSLPQFFQAFPNIKHLRISDVLVNCKRMKYVREILKPLRELRDLDVEVYNQYETPYDEYYIDDLTANLASLRELLGPHVTVRLFLKGLADPIREFKSVVPKQESEIDVPKERPN